MGSSHSKPDRDPIPHSLPPRHKHSVPTRPPSDPSSQYTWQSYHYYDLPRIDHPTQKQGGENKIIDQGSSHFPKAFAQDIIDRTPHKPYFTSRNTKRRPHAHMDKENAFVKERGRLRPHPDQVPLPSGTEGQTQVPVMYAYLVRDDYPYDKQNAKGKIQEEEKYDWRQLDAGPHRIIVDKDKNIQGMVTHWPHGSGRFRRAESKVEYYQVPRKRD